MEENVVPTSRVRRTLAMASRAKQIALSATVPIATDTYAPVPHSDFITLLTGKLIEGGYILSEESYYVNARGTQLVGRIDIVPNDIYEHSPVMVRSVVFRNSYDKTMRAALAAGASVIICSNGMIAGDMITFVRKHTTSVREELIENMDNAINLIEPSFLKLVNEAEIMKNYDLTKRQKAELLGIMYFEEEIMTAHQLGIVKGELVSSEHFKGDTLWDLYNNVTESLKRSHPSHLIRSHVKLHNFMRTVAGIGVPEDAQIVEDQETTMEQEEALAASDLQSESSSGF